MKGLIYTILGLFSFSSSDSIYTRYSDLPPVDDVARMARYIVHAAGIIITHEISKLKYIELQEVLFYHIFFRLVCSFTHNSSKKRHWLSYGKSILDE